MRDPDKISLELRTRRLALSTTTAVHRRRDLSLSGQYGFLLLDPVRRLAWLNNPSRSFDSAQAMNTALPPGWTLLEFLRFFSSYPPSSQLRLLILRKDYLGSAARQWTSRPLAPVSLFAGGVSGLPRAERISEAEFHRQLDRLRRPASKASRVVVGRYLYAVLRLVQARGHSTGKHDPLAQRLAGLVPAHLDVFLEALSLPDYHCRQLLLLALQKGIQERQRPALLTALPRVPAAAALIQKLGWEQEARSALLKLMDYPRALPLSALRALAQLKEPKTYPRLLEELAHRPSVDLYEMLRSLPGITPALDATVKRIWRTRPPAVPSALGSDCYEVALRHGDRPALQEVYRVFRRLGPNRAGYQTALKTALIRTFRDNLVLSGLDRNESVNPEKVASWLAKHRAADFRFDRVRRRWVLKPQSSTTPTNR